LTGKVQDGILRSWRRVDQKRMGIRRSSGEILDNPARIADIGRKKPRGLLGIPPSGFASAIGGNGWKLSNCGGLLQFHPEDVAFFVDSASVVVGLGNLEGDGLAADEAHRGIGVHTALTLIAEGESSMPR